MPPIGRCVPLPGALSTRFSVLKTERLLHCLRLFKTVLFGFTPVRQLFIGDVGGDVTRAHCHGV